MDKMKVTYEAMLSLAAEMALDEAVRKFRAERIYREIDQSLASGDEDTFYRLAKELNEMK
ncbi:IDEAL domain-containing protein [Paenibacillus sp. BIHB 4019]|uniref:IDEAL domain-containing protein n=1 Tax=Paenibacillus sp. BIHB 4019 TaxID=1870819 RepID=A0A1B2DME5_9BACL|nr:IDEAL domain-containing protein [Paenibacillus sp. BIHB 4019]ANY68890.1 IDEAL domain-containing protein [Paenibacillus sp. BIHB 4019]